MPFFQASLFPQASLLLAELDQAQPRACAPRHHSKPQSFTPRFDVTETSEAFELYGELPGIEQEDISINFTDAQTLQVTGKTQRDLSTVNAATIPATTATAETTQTEHTQKSSTEESHNATVEDEYDEADTPLTTPATSTATGTSATATENVAAEQQQEQQPQAPRKKYWVAERRVGTFAREFSFSKRIEQDGVQASLKNGILRVSVPKSQKPAKVQVKVL